MPPGTRRSTPPDANGLVAIAKGATVRGGHEFECIGYTVATDLWEMVNSWGTSFGVGGHFFMSTATLKALLADQGDMTLFAPIGAAPFPQPTPQPVPTPAPSADAALAVVATKWVQSNHTGANGTMAKALKVWLAAQASPSAHIAQVAAEITPKDAIRIHQAIQRAERRGTIRKS